MKIKKEPIRLINNQNITYFANKKMYYIEMSHSEKLYVKFSADMCTFEILKPLSSLEIPTHVHGVLRT